ncbi:hypothetical protein V6N11_056688 [Hibiscus sabdariffa]|uniref:GRF-type domain-containing protein n=1 Tax=Hibiscus sabdariffa TaxID=183260 RepID=A0ABR2T5J0_9ROSI
MEGENLDRECFCGARSSLTIGWKTSNPGRRFWGCGNYGKSTQTCNLFVWYDPPVYKQSRVVIVGLLRKIATMERERRNERTLLSGWGGHQSNNMNCWWGLAWWWRLACPWIVALMFPTRLSSKVVLCGGVGMHLTVWPAGAGWDGGEGWDGGWG